ncbi:vertnin [Pelodytes ibericus]
MTSHQELVQILLQGLQNAADCCSSEGLTSAALKAEQSLSSVTLPPASTRQFQGVLEVDRIAHNLYPSDAPRNMFPLKCSGPGSHLFEAASILVWGHPGMALELQVRTVVEMVLHKRFYLREMIDSKVMLQAVRFSLCTEDSATLQHFPMQILQSIYEADIRATCYPGTFSNMWHVYPLASVLQACIYSIYPERNQSIRPYFNRLIHPRCGALNPPTLHLMWSGQSLPPSGFRPNCFVPVVGLEESDTLPPAKTLQLLNSDPKLTYSRLRQQYHVNKSTFYRWKRQSHEHRGRVVVRYEAKQYLQDYLAHKGHMIPVMKFRQLFPSIPRSTYYAWKHDLLQEAVTSPFPSPPSTPPEDAEFLVTTAETLGGARRYLEHCISLNKLVPYQTFKVNFPSISRSTFYKWRKKALEYQASQNRKAPVGNRPSVQHRKAWVKNSKRLEARRKVQEGHMSYCRFRLLYPGISGSTYSLWKAAAPITPTVHTPAPSSPKQNAAVTTKLSSVVEYQPVAFRVAQFRVEAKLFLQRRFETQTFPSYREFQALYPTTARSTYYMWKRALHGGLTLINT